MLANLYPLGGNPQVIEQNGGYEKIAVTDSATLEVYEGSDSIFVVMTVCAPQCSSCARVYNKEWKLLGRIPAPWPHAVFPEAWIEDKRIRWRDNTAQWDEEIQ